MRLIKQNIERKDGSGTATLLPEEPEDMVSMFVFSVMMLYCGEILTNTIVALL